MKKLSKVILLFLICVVTISNIPIIAESNESDKDNIAEMLIDNQGSHDLISDTDDQTITDSDDDKTTPNNTVDTDPLETPTVPSTDETLDTKKDDTTNIDDDDKLLTDKQTKYTAEFICNGWIVMKYEDGSLEDGIASGTFSIEDGGRLKEIIIENANDSITITEAGEFTFDGNSGSLEEIEEDKVYSITVTGVDEDIDIRISGEKIPNEGSGSGVVDENSKVNLSVEANGWITLNDSDVKFENGNIEINFQVKENGKLASIIFENADTSLTIKDVGDFEFDGSSVNLSKNDDSYLLTINNVTKDILVTLVGSSSVIEQDKAVAEFTCNGWIVLSDADVTFDEDGNLTANFSIEDGGRLKEIIIENDKDNIIINSVGDFKFNGKDSSLKEIEEGKKYTLSVTGLDCDTFIKINGELRPDEGGDSGDIEDQDSKIKLNVKTNGWITLNDENVKFEDGKIDIVFGIEEDGKLSSVIFENADISLTITDLGSHDFDGSSVNLDKLGDNYLLSIDNVTKDITVTIVGSSTLPEEVHFDIDCRKEVLVVDEDEILNFAVPGGSDMAYYFQFIENVVCEGFIVKIGDQETTIGLNEQTYELNGHTIRLEHSLGPTNRMVYDLWVEHIVEDVLITPIIKHNVITKVNDDSRITLNQDKVIKVDDYGGTSLSWSVTHGSKIDDVTIIIGGKQQVITSADTPIDCNGVTGTITKNNDYYELHLDNIHLPVDLSINASDNIQFGGFFKSDNKTLIPFTPTTGSVTNHGFGFTITYTTHEDGSVTVNHTAAGAYYHSRPAKILYQSHYNGQVIPYLDSPITISVTVQCAAGCGRTETTSITIPYRSINVNIVDEFNNPIERPADFPTSAYSMDSRTFEFVPPHIDWYEYMIDNATLSKTASGTAMEQGMEGENPTIYFALDENERGTITLKYRGLGSVKVNYKDDLGNAIGFADKVTSLNDYRNNQQNVPILKDEWYDFVNVEMKTPTGSPSGEIISQDDENVTVKLLHGNKSELDINYIAKASVNVRYVDELGNDISHLMPKDTTFKFSGHRGDIKDIVTPELADYVYERMYITTSGSIISGELNATNKQVTLGFKDASTITVVYHAKASVNIRYIDDRGNPIDDLMPQDKTTIIEGLRGEDYSIIRPMIADYDFEKMRISTPDNEIESGYLNAAGYTVELNEKYASTIYLIYRAKASFKVEYIDDMGNSINDLILQADKNIKFEYIGHRDDKITILTPELTDYQFNSMRIEHPEVNGVKNESALLDTEKHIASMEDGYNSIIYVVYDYRATVYLKYETLDGKDIKDVFDPPLPDLLEGFRNRTEIIKNPDQGSYIFDHFEIETKEGQVESGFLHGGQYDPTLTYGVRDATTVTLKYRYIDLAINFKELIHDGKVLSENNTLHYGDVVDVVWTIENVGTAPVYPEVVFEIPSQFSFENVTKDTVLTDSTVKFNNMLKPKDSVELTLRLKVKTVSTNFTGEIKANIPENQEDISKKLYPDIDLSNNNALANIKIYNPPIIIRKVNDDDTKERLEDCYIEIYDEEHYLVYDGYSDSDGEWYVTGLYPGRYIIREREAPEGFVRSKDVHVLKVMDDMTARGTRIYNEPIKIGVQKLEAGTGNKLEGAVFGLFNRKGHMIDKKTTDKDGMCYFERLPKGKYTIEEIKAPEGYSINGKGIRINIDNDYENGKNHIVLDATIIDTGTNRINASVILLSTTAVFTSLGIVYILKKKKDDE